MSIPLVSIVILNWNGEGLIQDCLQSVYKTEYPHIEVIVVDNGTTDASLFFLRCQKKIKLVEIGRNYGFARGNNIGFAQARGTYVAALNNDMVVEPSWLNEPIKQLERSSEIGIISCRQMKYHERTIVDSLYHVVLKDLSFFPFGRGEVFAGLTGAKRTGYVLSASGGSAVYRKRMLDEIGGFDEHFFAYCEDVDLSLRAFLSGWRCLYVPEAVVFHRGSASFARVPEKVYYYGQRNRYLVLYKFFPWKMIFSRLPWILNTEQRILRQICFKQKTPALYASILNGILNGCKWYLGERKKNMKLLRSKNKQLQKLIEKKIEPLF